MNFLQLLKMEITEVLICSYVIYMAVLTVPSDFLLILLPAALAKQQDLLKTETVSKIKCFPCFPFSEAEINEF